MLFCGRKNGGRAGVRCGIVAGLIGIGLNRVLEKGFVINVIAFLYSGFHIMGGDRNLRRSYSVFAYSDREEWGSPDNSQKSHQERWVTPPARSY